MPLFEIGNSSSTVTSTPQRVQLKAKRGLVKGLSEARSQVSLSASRPVLTSTVETWLKPEERDWISLSADRAALASIIEKEMAALPLSAERADRVGFKAGGRIVAFELKNTKISDPIAQAEKEKITRDLLKNSDRSDSDSDVDERDGIESEGYGSGGDSWVEEDIDMLTEEDFTVHHGLVPDPDSETRLATILEDVEGESSAEKSDVAMHRQAPMTAVNVTNKDPVELTVSLRSDTRRWGKALSGRVLEYSEDKAEKKIQEIKKQIAANKLETAERKASLPEVPVQKLNRNYISVWERMTINRISRGVDSSNSSSVKVLAKLWEARAFKK